MRTFASRSKAKSAIDLLEEAIALLRAAPAGAFVAYYLGAVPFWLGLLYFVSDMGQSAFAAERLVGGSLGVALLFIWMKCWHAVFTDRLRHLLLLDADQPWTPGRIMRLIAQQTSIQPWGMVIRPLALIITIPFVWVSSFYQNVTVLGDGTTEREGRSLFSRAWHQAQLWPGQAHTLVSLLSLFALFVWLNVASVFFVAPGMLKTFLDIETEASRNSGALFNSTVLTATFALTLLSIDPIFKAVYVLRCFYGESLRTGQDLRVQLRSIQNAVLTAALVATLLFCQTSPGRAAEAAPQRVAVNSSELDRSIDEVLQRREYAWRSSRREVVKGEKEKGWFSDVSAWIGETLRGARKSLKRLIDWLRNREKSREIQPTGGGGLPIEEIAYLLLAAAAVLGGWALWQRMRRSSLPVIDAQVLPPLPDLQSEDVVADQLPEDGWLDLMRKALADGQRRLALRAAYLASLAHLGQRELLTIARYKSNRDYSRELQRRARSRETLLTAFSENVEAFERAWYGMHEVSDTTLLKFTQNLETIRAC